MTRAPRQHPPLDDPAVAAAIPQRLPLAAGLLLGLLCLSWGANAVSIKFSNQGMPPLMAATLRSIIAGGLVWAYARSRGRGVAFPRGQRRHAVIVGILFGLEFLFLYWGLLFTSASRSLIFLYTHPFWVALGAHFFLGDDRLTAGKLCGLILAFIGVVAVFQVRTAEMPAHHWIGDLMEVAAALFWALTTLYVKSLSTKVAVDHCQLLFAQLVCAIPLLGLSSLIFEAPAAVQLTPLVVTALLYQSVLVAAASYLVWFWMIGRYPVSRLAAFTFLTPLCGVILGGLVLNEPVTPMIWLGLACVAVGVYVVNR